MKLDKLQYSNLRIQNWFVASIILKSKQFNTSLLNLINFFNISIIILIFILLFKNKNDIDLQTIFDFIVSVLIFLFYL